MKIEGETHGDTAGVAFGVYPLGGDPLRGKAGRHVPKLSKEGVLRAVACMKKGEKVQILRTVLSVVARVKGHVSNAWQEADVIDIVNNGPCN